MTTRIFFVRHGKVNNPKKVWFGRLPGFRLSTQGKKQISETARILVKNKIDAIYASPLLRTKQSAKIIGDILNLPVNYSYDLLEIKSSMQGKSTDYIYSQSPNFNLFSSPTNSIKGETIDDVAKRVQKFTTEIIKNHKGKNIIAVTHGDPIMIAKAQFENLPIKIESLRPANGYIQEGKIYLAEFNSQ